MRRDGSAKESFFYTLDNYVERNAISEVSMFLLLIAAGCSTPATVTNNYYTTIYEIAEDTGIDEVPEPVARVPVGFRGLAGDG